MPTPAISEELMRAARELSNELKRLKFQAPVACVYDPLDYAWAPHELYLRNYGNSPRRVVFLGMNPGPFGMVQTGVPFGEVRAVRDWMKIQAPVGKPAREHPRRPVDGFACLRSEVSGRRLWGLFESRFGPPERFFASHFVANYCPLALFAENGANLTPDKLALALAGPLYAACDNHLRRLIKALKAEWIIGVGDFAMKRAVLAAADLSVQVGKILHPSPASPAANRDWAGQATRQLQALGVWLD